MTYTVEVNGSTAETTSYASATAAVKDAANAFVQQLKMPIRRGLYRSPKTTARLNDDRLRSAANLHANGLSFPRNAGNVTGKVAGFAYSITKH